MARSRIPDLVRMSGALRIPCISAIERYLMSGISVFFEGIARTRRLCSRTEGTRCSTKRMKDLIAVNLALRVTGTVVSRSLDVREEIHLGQEDIWAARRVATSQ